MDNKSSFKVGDRIEAVVVVNGNSGSPFTKTGTIRFIFCNGIIEITLDEPIDKGTSYQMNFAYVAPKNVLRKL